MRSTKFIDQLKRNRVALISLVVAIVSLSYNTWRNEASEDNRTQRLVSIEILIKLADLQKVVWHNHYDGDTENKGNLRTGWAIVLMIKDISTILDAPMPESAVKLWEVWDVNHQGLGESTEAKDAIINAIEQCRVDTLLVLQALD
ncbi:MAG: hypothetical protein ACR2QT_14800 [Woeseiaceae bacterium]